MELVQETIVLDPEESNELLFRVTVEGTDPTPARVRLVCESTDVSYMFSGRACDQPDVVAFVIPSMKGRLSEGNYNARVEVLLENRYFAPVSFNINFKKPVRVVAESLSTVRHVQPTAPKVSVVPIVKPKEETPKVTRHVVEKTDVNGQQVEPVTSKEAPASVNPTTLRERYKAKHVDNTVSAGRDLARALIGRRR